jgi:hypothetical protein
MKRVAWHHRGRWLLVCLGFSGVAAAQVTAFRMTDLDLRDPHLFTSVGICLDVTDAALNSQLQTSIQTDSNPVDGLLDLSNLFQFEPLDQSLTINPLDFGGALCTAPMAGTQCSSFSSIGLSDTALLQVSGSCLTPVSGTTFANYTPSLLSASAPCFASTPGTLVLNLSGIAISLSDAQVGATWVGVPASAMSNGLLRGFLSESAADAIVLPAQLPLVGGRPLSALLPGGSGNCSARSDKDIHQGVTGWWFYFNFTATEVLYSDDPFGNGFADGFED